MNLSNETIFVTGGAGVIGCELIPLLHKRGAKVIVGDLKKRPTHFAHDVIYRQGDLNSLTPEELKVYNPTVLIHLAATFERSTESLEFWEENYKNNVGLSHHIMTLFKNSEQLKFVFFASSYLIYDKILYQFKEPQNEAILLSEDSICNPRNLTGMAKFSHECELAFLAGFLKDKVKFANARIFRGYGKGSRCVISRWVRDLLAKKEIFLYNPDGIFDYIYAADTAKGIISIIENNVEGIVNLGTGKPQRVSEVISILKSHFPDLIVNKMDSDDLVESSGANLERLRSLTGWSPEFSLADGIKEIVEFEKQKLLKIDKVVNDVNGVLFLSSGAKFTMLNAVKDAARKINPACKVYTADISSSPLTSYLADGHWAIPKTEELSEDLILKFCKDQNINFVVPSRDGELRWWAEIKQALEKKGICTLVAPADSVQRCLDKLEFYNFCNGQSLPVIQTDSSLDSIDANRYVVKERFGSGAGEIGLNLDRKSAAEHGKKIKSPIFQPYIQGREFSADSWVAKDGDVKGVVLRWRAVVVGGESKVTKTFKDAKIESIVRDLVKRVGAKGHSVVQGLIDEFGKVHIIECNTRFGGASSCSVRAGLDTFYWSFQEAIGEDMSLYPFLRIEGEVTQVRTVSDIHIFE